MSTRNGTATPSDEVRVHAHRGDPVASIDAASRMSPTKAAAVKRAILELLAERPRAAFELQSAYVELRTICGWPLVQPHSVNRRLSDLHNEGAVRPLLDEDGEQVRIPSPAGATATVWECTPGVQEGRAAA
jgi:hypothetical protein